MWYLLVYRETCYIQYNDLTICLSMRYILAICPSIDAEYYLHVEFHKGLC